MTHILREMSHLDYEIQGSIAYQSGAEGSKNRAAQCQPLCANRKGYTQRMSLNHDDLIKQMNEASGKVLREEGYICFVDILIRMGKLTKEDYEAWRSRKVPYLERVIKVNLKKLNHMLRTLHQNAKKGGLLASKTAYMSHGKGPKTTLRFSKSGDPNIEEAYSTHFYKPKAE